jgi:hypothetical protein
MRYFLGCFFALILVSCSSDKKPPSDVIGEIEMKNILWDIMRAQALANQYAKADSTLNDSTEILKLTAKVFKVHGIESQQFDKSYDWYVKHPPVLKTIFDSLYTQKSRRPEDLQPPGQMKEENKRFERDRFRALRADSINANPQ